MAAPTPESPSAAVRQLRAALETALAERQQYQVALDQFAEVSARQVLYAVDRWCDLAEDWRNPRQLAARQLLEGWVRTMRRAEALASGLEVAREAPPAPASIQ